MSAAKPPLNAQLHLPAGDDSGPVYIRSDDAPTLMIVRLPYGTSPAGLPKMIAEGPGIVVTMDDGVPTISMHLSLKEVDDLRDCAVLCCDGPIFRGAPPEPISIGYISAVGDGLVAMLGGDGPATNDPRARQDGPILFEMLKVVFGRDLKPWLDHLAALKDTPDAPRP
jgi:hypothetical protein